ncbi:MAG TPA: class I SAM-dependent methyltransferase [Candidatus Binatia bacterium]|nr:class I SAM-dependent methyltransferase [Candidatus Binatia bacterium]
MIKLLLLVAKVGPRQAAWLLDIFEEKYGHFLSSQMRLPVTAAGEPLPWYTYPSIEYLQQLDFSARHVFEFGAGNGSQFWAQRAKSVTSVEHDPKWFEIVEQRKRPNQTLLLHENLDTYALAIATFARKFDLIIIDGKNRFACAKAALPFLEKGGMIILDNSDWHPKTAALLREADLIQIDFTGFGPVNSYTSTTSLFLHRAVRITPGSSRLPEPGIGSIIQDRDAHITGQVCPA